MKYRITYENKEATRFSYVEERDDVQDGEWEAPFTDAAKELVEGLLQSDRCPIDFFDFPIVSVKVRRMS